jgi:transcriptional regulator with XRE-family HTH domain
VVKRDTRLAGMDNPLTPSDIVAQRVRELRKARGMTVADLAAECAAAGMPKLTVQALYKLEAQRDRADRPPRPVSVDELLTLAYVLDAETPLDLLVPKTWQDKFPVTPTTLLAGHAVRAWFLGETGPLRQRIEAPEKTEYLAQARDAILREAAARGLPAKAADDLMKLVISYAMSAAGEVDSRDERGSVEARSFARMLGRPEDGT